MPAWVAIVVAVIAAGTSVWAAIRSDASAKRATAGAQRIARVGHEVANHDHRVTTFREDFSSFMALVTKPGLEAEGAMLARAAVFSTNPLADARMVELVDQIIGMRVGRAVEGLDDLVKALGGAVRAQLVSAQDERLRVLDAGD